MKIAVTATLCLLCAPLAAYAHNGGLDSNGCHNNKAKNVYECHQGSLQGQTFKSKAEAESRLTTENRSGGKPTQQTAKTPEPTGKPAKQTAKTPEPAGKPAQQTAKVPEPAGKPSAGTTAPPKR